MAHRYWKLGNLPGGGGGYTAGAEAYLRSTVGGSNLMPTASTSSGSYSSGPDVLYDGNPSTWWASNGGGGERFVAFDYGTAVDVAEVYFQARPDEHSQAPPTMTIQWSDTGLSGPWYDYADVTFGGWSSDGQIQTEPVIFVPGERVSEQAAYAVLAPPAGESVSEQAGFVVLGGPPGLALSEQVAYVVLVASSGPPPPTPVTRRRQYTLM